jgi:ribonucleoside-diphosphate reductase subunit M2
MSTNNSDFSRYSFQPINFPKLIEYYTLQRDAFWSPKEISFVKDRSDWLSLKDDERRFLTFVLSFFAQVDGIIIENLNENFQRETSEFKEVVAFYNIQNAMETIHNETYSLMIETFIQDINERNRALDAINHFPSIRNISDWIRTWMDPNIPLMERIIAFSCVEGILFTAAFTAIYWIKKSNLLRGLCKANEFIARDEAIHTNFAVALYHHYTRVVKKFPILSQEKVHKIISDAVNVSEVFIRDALRVDLIGMNAEDMLEYVKCTANWLATSFAYDKVYENAKNPFPWMLLITMQNKTNFFEDSVSEYSKTKSYDYTFTTAEPF